MDATLTWKNEGLLFEGTADTGMKINLASGMDEGKEGFRPMELMAMGLGSCTGMDVLSILKKKRQEVKDFEVIVRTKCADRPPYVWNWVQIEYIVTGTDIDPKAIERAMQLSATRYCPAQNMINKAVDVDLVYKIIEA